MKTKYIYQISTFLLGIVLLVGCTEFEEFKAEDLGSGPTLTISLTASGDSLITVDMFSNTNGYIVAALMTDTTNAIPEDPESLAKGDIINEEYFYAEVEANQTVRYTFTNSVKQNSLYEIMAVAANSDGVLSDIEVLEVATADTYAPKLLGAYPEFTYSPTLAQGDTVVLEFDEAVQLGEGGFSIETFFGGEIIEIPSENVSASQNLVFVILPDEIPYREYVWLHWEEGAIVDATGNLIEELTTYFDGDLGEFIGAYWRMAAYTYSVEGASPSVADAQPAGFDIVLSYPGNVGGLANVTDGTINLTYDNGAGIVTIVGVPAADVSILGTDVTILQTVFTPVSGTVTVDVPAGIFTVGYGNPTEAYSATWNLE